MEILFSPVSTLFVSSLNAEGSKVIERSKNIEHQYNQIMSPILHEQPHNFD